MKNTVSAGGVVLNKEGKVLVVNQHGNSWSLPKGHIDEGEEKYEAAIREIYEESGVRQLQYMYDLPSYERYKIALDGGDDKSELKVIHMFLFKTNQETLCPIDPDNPEAKWVDRGDVAELLTHKKDKEYFLSIIDRLEEPGPEN